MPGIPAINRARRPQATKRYRNRSKGPAGPLLFVRLIRRPARASSLCFSTRAAALPNLHGWAFHVSVRAEHAAVAVERMKQSLATGALVEVDARVGRHLLGSGRAALRAGDFRRQDNLHGISRIPGMVPGEGKSVSTFRNQQLRWPAGPYRHLSAGREQCKIDQDRPRCKNF
jgi:hypothetical protein